MVVVAAVVVVDGLLPSLLPSTCLGESWD